ncbi:hypothetical protein Gotri_020917, partial [Gossypium trilobum]|nr:hypothetical protein [Gossypium trilobum]
MALSVLVVVPGWWQLIILRVHVSMCILEILAFMLAIPIVDNNNQQWKSLAKVQGESPFEGEEMSVRCQLVLLLMEVAGSEGVSDEVTFEADVWRELLEIPLGFSSADHLVLMPSPPVSVSSPIRE